MRVLLTSFGTLGDVRPLVALGRGLRAAGHHVTFCSAPDHGPLVERHGLPFVPAGDPYRQVLAELDAGPSRVLAVMARQVPAQFAALGPLVDEADCVLSGSLEYATASLCERARRPRRSVLLAPSFVPAASQPMPFVSLRGLPAWLNRLTWWLTDLGSGLTIGKLVDAERGRLGLGPAGPLAAHVCGDEILLPFPRALGSVDAPDTPVRQLPPWLLDDDDALPAEVEAFLAAGPPPAYLGTGSMPLGPGMPALFAAAARRTGLRAIVAAPPPDGEHGDDILFVDAPLPHARLFPRCACVLHHGGAGTTIAAMRAGRPQVTLPLVADQHQQARAVHHLGLGPPPVPRRGLTPERLAAALRAAVDQADDAVLLANAAAIPTDGVLEGVLAVQALASGATEPAGP